MNALRHECHVPHIIDFVIRWMWVVRFMFKSLYLYCIQTYWMFPGASLDVVAKKNIPVTAENWTPVIQLTASHFTYWPTLANLCCCKLCITFIQIARNAIVSGLPQCDSWMHSKKHFFNLQEMEFCKEIIYLYFYMFCHIEFIVLI